MNIADYSNIFNRYLRIKLKNNDRWIEDGNGLVSVGHTHLSENAKRERVLILLYRAHNS